MIGLESVALRDIVETSCGIQASGTVPGKSGLLLGSNVIGTHHLVPSKRAKGPSS